MTAASDGAVDPDNEEDSIMPLRDRIGRKTTVATVATGAALAAALAGGAAYGSPEPAPAPTAGASQQQDQSQGQQQDQQNPQHKKHRKHRSLAKRTVHGQSTVRTKDGFHTVTVQRGTVAKAPDGSVTVTSPDHYAHTYHFDPASKVRLNKQPSTPDQLQTGQKVRLTTAPDSPDVVRHLQARTPQPKPQPN